MPILHEQSTEPCTSWKVLWKYLNSTNTKGSPLCDGLEIEDIWRRKKEYTAIKRNKKWRQIQEAYNLTLNPLNLTLPNFFTIRIKKKKSRSPPLPPNKLGVLLFFLLVHWPPILKHLNVSYTKFSSKWIWSKNMVKPTLIKVSV
jgi:hypothetical protein